MKSRALTFRVPLKSGAVKVSALLLEPPRPEALLVFAHGAGAGMRHSTMEALAQALGKERIATFRYQFPYMEQGSRRPDRPDVAVATVKAAIAAAAKVRPRLPLFAGGKSFGGRMTTTAAARGEFNAARALICFGFPLHPPKRPGKERAQHLSDVTLPMLFLQGTRDDLSDSRLLREVAKKLKGLTVHKLDGADHGYGVLKSSGRTPAELLAEVAKTTRAFCAKWR